MANNKKFLNIYALRAIAGISLASAIIMILLSTLVFIARVEDLESYKFPESKVPQNISDIHKQQDYLTTLHLLNKGWVQNRPLLANCSMVAILGGLLQVIFSGLVLLSDSKAVRLYLRKWVTVHFILVCISFIILLNTIILTEDTVEKRSWQDLTSSLRKYLESERPANDYSALYRFLGTGQHLICISVGTNLGIILLLMSAMLILMRNQQEDYESCD